MKAKGGKINPRAIAQREKERRALELRKAGKTYDQIAEALGMSYRTSARRLVARAFDRITDEPAEELKQLELARYDHLLSVAWDVMHADHYLVIAGGPNAGGCILDPRDPTKYLVDDGPKLAAIAQILKVSERRAKLLGLDAPNRSRVEVVTEDMVDAEIARREAELAANVMSEEEA